MPSNVSYEYAKAQSKYEQANTLSEKLAALQEMKSTAPSHKGAEKLRAEITKKMAAVRREMEKQKEQTKKRGGGAGIHVRKEGVGQIVLVGMPNSGKSTLLNELTGIGTTVDSYEFTTKKPVAGMMNFKNAMVQLVEVPAIIEGSGDGKANGIQVLSVVRNADAVVLVVAGKREEKVLREEFKKVNIIVGKEKPKIEIAPNRFKGVSISGKKHLKVKEAELVDFLHSLGMYNVALRLQESADMEKIATALDERIVYRKSIVVNPREVKDWDELKEKLFGLLDKILIYTKKPGEEADLKDPMVLPSGSTVEEVAKRLHKDFATKLRYVRVWGSSKFPGQRVSRDYELKDGDVIEVC